MKGPSVQQSCLIPVPLSVWSFMNVVVAFIFTFQLLHSVSYGESTTCLLVSVCVVGDPEMIVQGVQLLYEERFSCLLPSHVCRATCDHSPASDVQYHDYPCVRLHITDSVPLVINRGVYHQWCNQCMHIQCMHIQCMHNQYVVNQRMCIQWA